MEVPPSPPATHSSKSSPDMPQGTSPGFTPPKSPDVKRSASPPPRCSSPLPPLPAEVFLLILKHIELPRRPDLRLVSRSWASFLNSEPQLWPTLSVALHGNSSTEHWTELWCSRASLNTNGKSSGGIREIVLNLDSSDRGPGGAFSDMVSHEVVVRRMQHVFRCAQDASVSREVVERGGKRLRAKRSTLVSFKLSCHPNTPTSLYVLNELITESQSALFERIENINLFVNSPQQRFTRDVLMMWPTVVNLTLRFPERSVKSARKIAVNRNWKFAPPARHGPPPTLQVLEHIRTLYLSGVSISRNLDLPLMPNLTRLILRSVTWEGKALFRLLRYVRKTIEHLELAELVLEEEMSAEMEQDEWELHVNIRDADLIDDFSFPDDESNLSDERIEDPAPIILSRLQTLRLEGNTTPPIFSSLEYVEGIDGDPTTFPTPIFVMPHLVTVTLDDIVTEQDLVLDEANSALALLGRNAPNVQELNLTTSVATDDAIFHCLAAMSAQMRRLSFYDSEVSDLLVCKLVDLVPRLEHLDVRRCTSITTQSIARFVEMLRETHRTKLKTVLIDPPDDYSTYWDRVAYNWLDFIGVLVRSAFDYEGDGPDRTDEKARLKWVVEGKTSWERSFRLQWEAERKEIQTAALAQLALMQAQQTAGGAGASGGGSGSASRPNVAAPDAWYQVTGYTAQQQQQPVFGHFAPPRFPSAPPTSISTPSQAAAAQEQPHPSTIDPRLAHLASIRSNRSAGTDST